MAHIQFKKCAHQDVKEITQNARGKGPWIKIAREAKNDRELWFLSSSFLVICLDDDDNVGDKITKLLTTFRQLFRGSAKSTTSLSGQKPRRRAPSSSSSSSEEDDKKASKDKKRSSEAGTSKQADKLFTPTSSTKGDDNDFDENASYLESWRKRYPVPGDPGYDDDDQEMPTYPSAHNSDKEDDQKSLPPPPSWLGPKFGDSKDGYPSPKIKDSKDSEDELPPPPPPIINPPIPPAARSVPTPPPPPPPQDSKVPHKATSKIPPPPPPPPPAQDSKAKPKVPYKGVSKIALPPSPPPTPARPAGSRPPRGKPGAPPPPPAPVPKIDFWDVMGEAFSKRRAMLQEKEEAHYNSDDDDDAGDWDSDDEDEKDKTVGKGLRHRIAHKLHHDGIIPLTETIRTHLLQHSHRPKNMLWHAKNMINSLPPLGHRAINKLHKHLSPLQQYDEPLFEIATGLSHYLHDPRVDDKNHHPATFGPAGGALYSALSHTDPTSPSKSQFSTYHDLSQQLHNFMFEHKDAFKQIQTDPSSKPLSSGADPGFLPSVKQLLSTLDPAIGTADTGYIQTLVSKIADGSINSDAIIALTVVMLSLLGLNYDSVADFLAFISEHMAPENAENPPSMAPNGPTREMPMDQDQPSAFGGAPPNRGIASALAAYNGGAPPTAPANGNIGAAAASTDPKPAKWSETTLKDALLKTHKYKPTTNPLVLIDRKSGEELSIKHLMKVMEINPDTWYQQYPRVRKLLTAAYRGRPDEWVDSGLSHIVPIPPRDMTIDPPSEMEDAHETAPTKLLPSAYSSFYQYRKTPYRDSPSIASQLSTVTADNDYLTHLDDDEVASITGRMDALKPELNAYQITAPLDDLNLNAQTPDMEAQEGDVESDNVGGALVRHKRGMPHPHYHHLTTKPHISIAPHDAQLIPHIIGKNPKHAHIAVGLSSNTRVPLVHNPSRIGTYATAPPIHTTIYPKIVRANPIKLLQSQHKRHKNNEA